MRDIAVTLLFFFLIYYTLRKPFIGVAAWAWITLAFPAGWAWGFSTNFRMNFSIAILTFVGYVFMKNKPKFRLDTTSFLLVILWLCALISTMTSQSLLIDFAWGKFSDFSKVLLFYLAIILIVSKKVHIDTIIWSVVLSVSSFAAMEAVKFLLSFGGHRVAGFQGHIIGDRNDLAVAINMSIPLILYLVGQTKHKMLRSGLMALAALNVLAIIGSYSRGGFVGLVILAGYFFLKSNRKFVWSIAILITLGIASAFVPSQWAERMNTVSTASTQDNSFIGRIWAWKISVKIANDNFFGNSFLATQDPIAWHQYREEIDNFGPIATPPIPEEQFAKAAHSIYFQVLGDIGYIGLVLYLWVLYLFYRRLNRLVKKAKQLNIEWCEHLARMMSISLVGFAITGANVSLAYFDLIYVLIAMSFVLERRILVEPVSSNRETSRHNFIRKRAMQG
ncbi:putative O-glycosylation ligase, exosortase A system-associated [Litorilituus sediminis]|uniref:Putative O-glycosylation ligase, exosortase A system-associated n=1 Tax=Litorilituus sediminis TaxID=718192 RepID=A0A4P6P7W1_9GAMM|nr:putative O-glycosylation ligase, exosortase A system-associated [Litorilituus sediminis]QBG36339.1 putative O-glycosylation ligase, exosortase A system-associated [Litorilituus sediminis]